MTNRDEIIAAVETQIDPELGPIAEEATHDRELSIARRAADLTIDRLVGSLDVDSFFAKALDHQLRVVDLANGHNQVFVLAGYAGYFALWSAMAAKIPDGAMLASGSLMGISVAVFVGWTVIGMITMRSATQRILQAIEPGPIGFLDRQTEAQKNNVAENLALMRFWKPVVWIAGTTALVAATILTTSSAISFVGDVRSQRAKVETIAPKSAIPVKKNGQLTAKPKA